jgi:hypothetical protein
MLTQVAVLSLKKNSTTLSVKLLYKIVYSVFILLSIATGVFKIIPNPGQKVHAYIFSNIGFTLTALGICGIV